MTSVRGRPRGFDRNRALEQIMAVFQSKGFEGTQLTDLLAATGINPPSFYAAFQSKEAAFLEAVDLYVATVGQPQMRALKAAGDITGAIRAMIEGSIAVALSARPGGCLLILGAMNCLPANAAARDRLAAARRETTANIAARLAEAVRTGELIATTPVETLANFYHGVLQGISCQARDGADQATLTALIDPALAALAAYRATPS